MVLKHISWEHKSGWGNRRKMWAQSVLRVFYYYLCQSYYYYIHEVSVMSHNMGKLKHWERVLGTQHWELAVPSPNVRSVASESQTLELTFP